MLLDPVTLAARISLETGLALFAEDGETEGYHWIVLRPSGHEADHTFAIRISMLWRRLKLEFLPGKFARPLLQSMAAADPGGRSVFHAMIADCVSNRASVELQIDGVTVPADSPDIWGRTWGRFSLTLNRGNLELGIDEGRSDFEIVSEWTLRFAAAALAILPLEQADGLTAGELPVGFPEGDGTAIVVNRYERDRRNRAAAIVIHGVRCKGCGMDFGERYGEVAAGYIEVHHTVPISRLGPGYVINPALDLVPLCANCHRVAHRTDPPLSVEAIVELVETHRR